MSTPRPAPPLPPTPVRAPRPSPAATPGSASLAATSEVTLGDVAAALWRRAGLLVLCGIVLGLALGLYAYTRPRTYTATMSFAPQASGGGASRLAGLASQFGLGMIGEGSGQSPAFYAGLLRSRGLLRSAASARYTVHDDGVERQATLVDVFGVEAADSALAVEQAVDRLERQVDVQVGRETGLVTVRVRSGEPELSQQLAAALLTLVEQFQQRLQQGRAEAERAFTEERLEESRAALRVSEDRLRQFLRANREFRFSPDLSAEHDQLQREVDLQRQLFTSLAQALAQARVDAARDTPTISVVEPPALPARPDARGTVVHALTGGIAGVAIAALLVLWVQFGPARSRSRVTAGEARPGAP